jgi:hypothetical protein
MPWLYLHRVTKVEPVLASFSHLWEHGRKQVIQSPKNRCNLPNSWLHDLFFRLLIIFFNPNVTDLALFVSCIFPSVFYFYTFISMNSSLYFASVIQCLSLSIAYPLPVPQHLPVSHETVPWIHFPQTVWSLSFQHAITLILPYLLLISVVFYWIYNKLKFWK